MRVLFLDVDGVLNRTRFRPDEVVGLRSWIEPELAQRLSDVLREIGAEIVLSSDWRCGRQLQHLRDELLAAGIETPLLAVTPVLTGQPRWREIEAWMNAHGVGPEAVVIVDDGFDMGVLAARFVRASPLNGLDESCRRRDRGTLRTGAPLMQPRRALHEFQRFLAGRMLRVEMLTVADGIEAMLAFYREVRAKDTDVDKQGDMLLYQWGTYDWGKGRFFELDLTRQLIVGDGEDDDIWQLHLTYYLAPSPSLDALGRDNHWCESPDELDDMYSFILSSPAYVAASTTPPLRVALMYECAG